MKSQLAILGFARRASPCGMPGPKLNLRPTFGRLLGREIGRHALRSARFLLALRVQYWREQRAGGSGQSASRSLVESRR